MPKESADSWSRFSIIERDHVQGHATAPVTLVEYGDYACYESGLAHSAVLHVQNEVGGRMRFIFRHFALSGLHAESQRAAEAAEAAGAQGRFWAMHNRLFAHRSTLDDASLLEYADALRLDIGRFLREMATHHHRDRVREDFRSAKANGVHMSPAFFINGAPYSDVWSVDGLQLAVMEEASAIESR